MLRVLPRKEFDKEKEAQLLQRSCWNGEEQGPHLKAVMPLEQSWQGRGSTWARLRALPRTRRPHLADDLCE